MTILSKIWTSTSKNEGELSSEVKAALATADEARDSRDWARASEHYRKVVDAEPTVFHIWVQLGNCLNESGHLQRAADAYGRAVALIPKDSDVHLQHGHLRKLECDTEAA